MIGWTLEVRERFMTVDTLKIWRMKNGGIFDGIGSITKFVEMKILLGRMKDY